MRQSLIYSNHVLRIDNMGSDEAKIEKKRLKAEQKMAKKAAKEKEKKESLPVGVDGTELHAKEGEKTFLEQQGDRQLSDSTQNQRVPPIEPAPTPAPENAQPTIVVQTPTVPWYKNPDWIRAIAAIASLIVAIIAIFLTLF